MIFWMALGPNLKQAKEMNISFFRKIREHPEKYTTIGLSNE